MHSEFMISVNTTCLHKPNRRVQYAFRKNTRWGCNSPRCGEDAFGHVLGLKHSHCRTLSPSPHHTHSLQTLASLGFLKHCHTHSRNLSRTHTPKTDGIPEIACIICLDMNSRSSSDRCACLSMRATCVWPACSGLAPKSLLSLTV